MNIVSYTEQKGPMDGYAKDVFLLDNSLSSVVTQILYSHIKHFDQFNRETHNLDESQMPYRKV